jgi:hypothetical protein
MQLPSELHWLFWESAVDALEVERDANYLIPRILEFGRLADVSWVLRTYGKERIHAFLRDVGHPELSPRTLAFWRAFFSAEGESWASPPPWRTTSSAPWPG